MATQEQRTSLLAVTCPHCAAVPGEPCGVTTRRDRDAEGGLRRRTRPRITTLDGGAHDARWIAAGLGHAQVMTEALAELRPPRTLVGASADRPW